MSSFVRPAHALGVAATAAIAIAVAAEAVEAALAWTSASAEAAEAAYGLSSLAHVAAGIAFVAWMHRARRNADAITSTHHARWTNPWVFVGWIIPLANVYIPYAVMQDIWRGSDRTQPTVGLWQRPLSGLVRAWWLTYLGSTTLSAVAELSVPEDFAGTSPLRDVAVMLTIATPLSVVAAVLAGRMIWLVNEMQVSVPSASPAPAA
ncbi:DUF4328 domain-containing protein [Lentzea sp. CA-135723]|uniref:DUF4328 domain-containing protein n=1 Tax=Lentzea sp. CA-135723 TaxID=3239950 RepID=UPI003D9312D5